VTASAVAISHGVPAPSPDAVRQLASALDAIADAVQAGVAPSRLPELPSDEPLRPVIEAVRAVLGVLAGPREPAPGPDDVSGADAAPRRPGSPRALLHGEDHLADHAASFQRPVSFGGALQRERRPDLDPQLAGVEAVSGLLEDPPAAAPGARPSQTPTAQASR
jgi:hypothetical protein